MTLALKRTVARLRSLVHRPGLGERSDRQLLEAFARTGDESAFTLVVRRHGSLVLGVCRRILGHHDDAEDAFQATFLVLARKAGEVAWEECVRNWLHGVALRVARKARAARTRRSFKERQARSAEVMPLDAAWAEVSGLLDEELNRLPPRYRAPILLCCLEGKTREEAAHELGWSQGSVKGRLERGRELLRQRLQGRGLTLGVVLGAGLLTAAPVSAALAEAAARAAVPFAAGNLAAATTSSAAIQLAQGVLHAMLIAKCKITGFALTLVAALGIGTTMTVHFVQAERPTTMGVVGAVELPFTMPDFTGIAEADAQVREAQERKEERKAEERKEVRRDEAKERKEERKEPRKDEPRREERKDERGIRGILRKIDVKVGNLTIQSLRDGEEKVEQTYSLAGKDVKVYTPIERPVALADLREGLTVTLLLNEAKDVTAIRADLPALRGLLTGVDAANKTITLRAGDRERANEGTTYKVAPDARIQQLGRPTALGELKAQQPVSLVLSFDKETVLAIEAGRPEAGREGPGDRRPAAERDERGRLGGVVTDVDVGKSTISLLVGRDNNLSIKTLTIGKDVQVRLAMEGRPLQELTLAEVGKAVQAWVVMGDDLTTVRAINIMAPTMRQRIKAVDAAGKKITVESEEKETTFDIAADVKITRGRLEATLADVKAGANAILALSPDRRRVLAVILIPTERDQDR